jgi:hypothetical protein
MAERTSRLIRSWTIALYVGLAIILGCAGIEKPGATNGQSARGTEKVPASSPAQPSTGDDQVLAAVTDFLTRTKEYQIESSSAEPASKMSAAQRLSTRNETGLPLEAPGSSLTLPANTPSETRAAFANTHVDLESEHPIARPSLTRPILGTVTVRPREEFSVASDSLPEAVSLNAPLDVGPKQASSLDDRIQELKGRLTKQEDLDADWERRMLLLAVNRDRDAREPSPYLAEEIQRIFVVFVEVATAVRSALRNRDWADPAGIQIVEELKQLLRVRLDPAVSSIALCRRVVTFGVYEEMDLTEFSSGKAAQTIVYSEIENLQSQTTEDGRHRVALRSRLELMTADGRSIWQQDEPEIVDLCRRRRSDFFLAQRVTFPPDLRPGDYVLKVFVEDKTSGRGGESVHTFTVKPRLPTG